MEERFKATLIGACAATLAGLKCASMFSYRAAEGEPLEEEVCEINELLSGRGVRARVLGSCGEGKLVYVYRPRATEAKIASPETRRFLAGLGYSETRLDGYLDRLGERLGKSGEFPHEIGVFLDYPLADVKGFMQKGSRECLCSGCWKAYSDPEKAEKRFEMYRRCRRVYADCYRRGFDLRRLTVAA